MDMLKSALRNGPVSIDSLISSWLEEFCHGSEITHVGDALDAQMLQVVEEFDSKRLSGDGVEKNLVCKQAKYLAEEIYLAHYQHLGDYKSGVSKFIMCYVERHYEQDQDRLQAAHHICEEIRASSNTCSNDNAKDLLEKLTERVEDDPAVTRCCDVVFLPRNCELFVIGDSHGDEFSTSRILNEIQNRTNLNQPSGAEKPFIVFLGDYVNNGLKNVDNLRLILQFQRRNLRRVVLLSGNHEFRETFHTALTEYFDIHWNNAIKNPFGTKNPLKDNHYGHIRLELARRFGIPAGENLYRAFERWGMSLPYICLVPDGIMLSHSLGRPQGATGSVQLVDLIDAKHKDANSIKRLGFEAWKKHQISPHAAMVNNRVIGPALLREFGEGLNVSHFVVGHSHYRSGDILSTDGRFLITICSSDQNSPDAGHYMYQEMVRSRREKVDEGLPVGDAFAGYLAFKRSRDKGWKVRVNPVDLSRST